MDSAIKKEHLVLLAVNLALILGLGTLFVTRRNYEFILYVGVIVPQSGVGGYLNTSLDLCSDLIGAIIALVYLHVRYPPREERL